MLGDYAKTAVNECQASVTGPVSILTSVNNNYNDHETTVPCAVAILDFIGFFKYYMIRL